MAEGKSDSEEVVSPGARSAEERAAMKAKINSIWEELKGRESVPAKVGVPKVQKVSKPRKSSKPVPGWMLNLGLAPSKGSVVRKPSPVILQSNDKFPKVSNGGASIGTLQDREGASHQDRVDLNEREKFPQVDSKVNEVASRVREEADMTTNSSSNASEDIKDSKDSKASIASRRKSEMQASSSSGLDNLLQQISKKQKPNILDRSRKDWGQFKEEKGLEDELEAYKKSGDKYLDKVAFLQRSDVREYEKERDARLALQSKRQSETASLN